MKFQAPPNCGGVSVMGNYYEADENGVIVIEDIPITPDALAPFGYVHVSDDYVPTALTKAQKKAAADAAAAEAKALADAQAENEAAALAAQPTEQAPATEAPVETAPATEAAV